ncbi:MAG: hypothetical protein WAX44_00025 [Minisyncoccia bacterium]
MRLTKTNIVIVLFGLLFVLLVYYFLNKKVSENVTVKNCLSEVEKYDCWSQSLKNTLNKDGLSSAFEVLANFYETDPNFVSECHGFTHELGQWTYEIFSRDKDIELSPKTSYCGFGFYHGFMEALLQEKGSIEEAEKFCAYADKQLSLYNKKTNIACYHGIGHGAVDGSGSAKWGSPQEFISTALKICKTVSSSNDQVYQCGTGVFNSLAIVLSSGSFDLNFSGNPYNICQTQDEDFKRACYEQMNTRVSGLASGALSSGVKYILEIPEKKYAVYAMDQLSPATIMSRVGKNQSFESEIRVCKSLPEYLRKPCVEGLAGGILEFGKPDSEYVEALNLCSSNIMDDKDRKVCYNYVISSLGVLYSKEKITEICTNIDQEFRSSCPII